MTKTILFLFTLLMFVSCGKSGGGSPHPVGAKVNSVSSEEVSTSAPVPNQALNFEVNFKLDNFNAQQEDKILKAGDLIKKVVASEEFKNAILNFTYNGKKEFIDNGGKTNAQIYAAILEGAEKLNPANNSTMDIELEVTYRADNVVGFTYPGQEQVWMNSKYLDQNAPISVTTNIMHEWLHKIGFEHSFENTPSRPYSVPYAVGYLVAKLAANHI